MICRAVAELVWLTHVRFPCGDCGALPREIYHARAQCVALYRPAPPRRSVGVQVHCAALSRPERLCCLPPRTAFESGHLL